MFVDDSTRLRHMLDAARKATAKASGHTRDELNSDEDLAVILLHWIQIMGEAARLISPELKSKHSEVEWEKIQGMRHRVVHDYDSINLDIVWAVSTADAPVLAVKLEAILQEIAAEEG